jgi:hypothetical protein
MKRLTYCLIVAIAAAAASLPTSARACSFPGPIGHVIDESMQATDQMPPTLAPIPAPEITRGKGSQQTGCSQYGSTSCDDIGRIALAVLATDDATPSSRIGYRLTIVTGAPPSGLSLPSDAVEPSGDDLALHWIDGATDDQESFDFTLRVVAVDLAGNESVPQTVRIADDRDHACAVARGGGSRKGLVWLGLLPLLLATRRRPRRRG